MISKEKLQQNVNAVKNETKEALQLMYSSLNNGQQKKLVKNAEVKALLERYGII
jgi:predicted aminopeptidase